MAECHSILSEVILDAAASRMPRMKRSSKGAKAGGVGGQGRERDFPSTLTTRRHPLQFVSHAGPYPRGGVGRCLRDRRRGYRAAGVCRRIADGPRIRDKRQQRRCQRVGPSDGIRGLGWPAGGQRHTHPQLTRPCNDVDNLVDSKETWELPPPQSRPGTSLQSQSVKCPSQAFRDSLPRLVLQAAKRKASQEAAAYVRGAIGFAATTTAPSVRTVAGERQPTRPRQCERKERARRREAVSVRWKNLPLRLLPPLRAAPATVLGNMPTQRPPPPSRIRRDAIPRPAALQIQCRCGELPQFAM